MRLGRPDDGRTPNSHEPRVAAHERRRASMRDIRIRRSRLAVSAVAAVAVVASTAGIANGRGDAAPALKAHHVSRLHRAAHFEQAQLKHGVLTVEGTQGSDTITLALHADRPDVLQVDL